MDFNVLYVPEPVTPTSDIRPETVIAPELDEYRDKQTGRVGVDITVRPEQDDPLAAFGDPDYYFQNKLIIQHGLV